MAWEQIQTCIASSNLLPFKLQKFLQSKILESKWQTYNTKKQLINWYPTQRSQAFKKTTKKKKKLYQVFPSSLSFSFTTRLERLETALIIALAFGYRQEHPWGHDLIIMITHLHIITESKACFRISQILPKAKRSPKHSIFPYQTRACHAPTLHLLIFTVHLSSSSGPIPPFYTSAFFPQSLTHSLHHSVRNQTNLTKSQPFDPSIFHCLQKSVPFEPCCWKLLQPFLC